MGLLDLLFGNVEMPARVGRGLIEDGIRRVREAAEAETRARQERDLSDVAKPSDSGARFKTSDVFCPSDCPVFTNAKKRPPDLHAAVLSFPARLVTLVREKCGGRSVVAYKRAGVARNVYARIVADDAAKVSKRTAMQFCIGLQLSKPEADLLLKSAGYAFSGTIPEDLAFVYCIENQILNLADVNAILGANGLQTIAVE